MAGLSFGVEKLLKKVFGGKVGPQEVELYRLVQMMHPSQKLALEKYLVGRGVVSSGAAQHGGFLGMLASIGIPLAISLVKKVLGRGMQVSRARSRRSAPPRLPAPPTGRGMQMRPPPVFGRWEDWERPFFGLGKKDEVQGYAAFKC